MSHSFPTRRSSDLDRIWWAKNHFSFSSYGRLVWGHRHSARLGWLGTGDAELKSRHKMSAFELHYAGSLETVDTITIPHHGSIHNYNGKLGNIRWRSVLTAECEVDPKGHHPSRKVVSNLKTKSRYTHIVTLNKSSFLTDWFKGILKI